LENNFRDILFELCESTVDKVPLSLQLVVSKLPGQQDKAQLFLGLVYILTLESGFEPLEDGDLASERSSPGSVPSLLGHQKAYNYNSQKVMKWSKDRPNSHISGHPQKWRFSTGGLGQLTLSTEFVQSGKSTTLALVTG